MRLVSNRWSREKLAFWLCSPVGSLVVEAKERAAVQRTKFSVRELREFRQVFRSYQRPLA